MPVMAAINNDLYRSVVYCLSRHQLGAQSLSAVRNQEGRRLLLCHSNFNPCHSFIERLSSGPLWEVPLYVPVYTCTIIIHHITIPTTTQDHNVGSLYNSKGFSRAKRSVYDMPLHGAPFLYIRHGRYSDIVHNSMSYI